jgi:predicted nucleotidyltransferase component of viral defense system
MNDKVKNLPASVHDRLKNLARQAGRPFQEYFYYYAIECFLNRLSSSRYKEDLVLKGGLMFAGWGIPLRRPTRDIDLNGYLADTVDNIVAVVREICVQEVEPDGMRFTPDSVRGEQIIDTANYPGIRVYLSGYLGQARIYLHVDVSFGNVITPGEIIFDYPSLLGMPVFDLRGYPIETAIAEKFQAMVVLENINDRMKDFYDIWLLSQQANIAGETLVEAIRATFTARRTRLPDRLPVALSEDFARLREADWKRFLRRSLLSETEIPAFSLVIDTLKGFLWPAAQAAFNKTPFKWVWRAGGAWQEGSLA